jgi:RHS repeat-associated protein
VDVRNVRIGIAVALVVGALVWAAPTAVTAEAPSPRELLDPSFGEFGEVVALSGTTAGSSRVALRPDGGFFVYEPRLFALRSFDIDGQLIPSFGAGGEVPIDAPDMMVSDSLGRLVVAELLPPSGGVTWTAKISRYLSSGEVDLGFGDSGVARVVVDDGRLVDLIVSPQSEVAFTSDRMWKLTESGQLDTSFGSGGSLVVEGQVIGNPNVDAFFVVGSNAEVDRFGFDGTMEDSFERVGAGTDISRGFVNDAGRVIVTDCCDFGSNLWVFDADGSLNTTATGRFADGRPVGSYGSGGFLMGEFDEASEEWVVRAFDSADEPAAAFGDDGTLFASAAAVQQVPDGSWRLVDSNRVRRYQPGLSATPVLGGDIDIDFGSQGRIPAANTQGFVTTRALVPHADGSLVEVDSRFVSGVPSLTVRRLDETGGVDPSFGTVNLGEFSLGSNGLAPTAGRNSTTWVPLADTTSQGLGLARLTASGIDGTWGDDGVLSIHSTQPFTFGDSSVRLRSFRELDDGSVLLGLRGDTRRPYAVKLRPDGAVDTSYGAAGFLFSGAFFSTDLYFGADGSTISTTNTTTSPIVVRYTPDGTRDASFQPPVFVGPSNSAKHRFHELSDGSLLFAVRNEPLFVQPGSLWTVNVFASDGSTVEAMTGRRIYDLTTIAPDDAGGYIAVAEAGSGSAAISVASDGDIDGNFFGDGSAEATLGGFRLRATTAAYRAGAIWFAWVSSDSLAWISRIGTPSGGPVEPPAPPTATYGDQPGGGYVEDPVHTGSGSLFMRAGDVTSGATGPWGLFERSYNSRDRRVGVFGRGWSTALDSELRTVDGGLEYRAPDGRTTLFADNGAGGFSRPDGVFADLEVVPDGHVLDEFDGDALRFDASGRLASVESWTGQQVDFVRSASGVVDEAVWSTGESLTFEYDTEGLLVLVTAGDGRQVEYAYTAGQLTSVVAIDGSVDTYTWTVDDFLASVTGPDGVVIADSIYDDLGRVVSQTTPMGTATFAYDDLARATTVTNVETGETTTYFHDEALRLIGAVDDAGGIATIELNDDGLRTSTTDRLGNTPTVVYDAFGNVTSSSDPVRGVTSYEYDTQQRLVETTSPTGAVTTLTYDGDERLPSSVTDGLGNTTTFVVDDGLIVSAVDPDGVSTTHTYDARRRLIAITDGAGATTTFEYDTAGRRVATTTPLGHTTRRTLDDAGRVLTETAPDGGATTYTYDSFGRALTVTDAVGAVTANTYDPTTGFLAAQTDPLGRVTTYSYDDVGQLISTVSNDGTTFGADHGLLGRTVAAVDELGRSTSFDHDPDGNPTETTAPDGGSTTTEYDTAGRIAALIDPVGRRTEHVYDQYARLVQVIRPDTTTIDYGYDILDRRTSVTAPDGGVATTTYTPAGRTATVTDPEGGVRTFAYDAAGRIASVTDPNGNTTTNTYDLDGRRTAVTSPEGLATTWTYDPNGRVLTMVDPAGVAVERTYTLVGQVASERTTGESARTSTYNLDGTLATVTDALGNTTTLAYDDMGRLSTRTDATGATETWTYNDAGELTTHIDRLGRSTTLTYDPNGRLAGATDPTGRTVAYSYNTAGELQSRTYGDGTSVAYTYDALGRRATMTDTTGTTTYTYDPADRPTEVAGPGGTLRYAYDLNGRRTALTYPDGTTANYTYDPAGRLTELEHPDAGTTTYTHSPDGRLTETQLSNAATRSFAYTDGRLTTYTDHGQTTELAYDNAGRVSNLTGAQTASYTYDAAGQLLQAVQDDGTYTYSYGPRGEITSITDPDRSRTFTHNANAEIDSITDNEGRTGEATYDDAGRMIEHVDPDGTITTYTYDARGLLIESTITEPGATPVIPYPEPDPNQPTSGSVSPIFECWAPEPDGTYTAYWGYENNTVQNGQPVGRTITHGNQNKLTPSTVQGTQPERFGVPGVIAGRPGRTAFGAQAPNAFVTAGWNGSNLVWKLGNRTATASITPSKKCATVPPPTTGDITTTTRAHDGNDTLIAVTSQTSTTPAENVELLWDETIAVPQIAVWDGGQRDYGNLIYGPQREYATDAGVVFNHTAFGDNNASAPFGDADQTSIDFGYRGELAIYGEVHLRNRTLLTDLGIFHAPDPLDGVAGTTTITNPYHYTDNDPINALDPLGLRPDDADFGTYKLIQPIPSCSPIREGGLCLDEFGVLGFDYTLDSSDNREWQAITQTQIEVCFGESVVSQQLRIRFDNQPELRDICLWWHGQQAPIVRDVDCLGIPGTDKCWSPRLGWEGVQENFAEIWLNAATLGGYSAFQCGRLTSESYFTGDLETRVDGLGHCGATALAGLGASGARIAVSGVLRPPKLPPLAVAPQRALPAADVAVIGKVDDLGSYTLRPGERTLLNQLPNQGSPRLNYVQNDRVLRIEMGRGVPIRDVSVDPVTGALRNNTGFLRAERNILTNHGWVFDPKSGYWYPPG